MGIDLAVATVSSPFIAVYPFSELSGFGAKYTNPATLPGSDAERVRFTTAGTDVGVSTDNAPRIFIYPWINGVGFGAKYGDPSTLLTGEHEDLAFTPDGSAIGFALGSSPWTLAYPWAHGSGFGAKYANPGVLLDPLVGFGAQGVTFTPDGSSIILGFVSKSQVLSAQPFISAYPWSGGFGAKYSDPTLAGVTAAGVNGVAASPGSDAVLAALFSTGANGIVAFPFTSGSGFGAAYANASGIAGTGGDATFTPAGDTVFLQKFGGTYALQAWRWTGGGGFGTKYSDTASFSPANFYGGVATSAAGTTVAMGSGVSPFLRAWPFAVGSGFGVQYAAPATILSQMFGVAFTGVGVLPPSPTQPDDCGPKNLAPKPLSLIDPEPVVKVYPHVTEITDWPAQQSIKLLWDRIHDHESRMRAGLANDAQWVGAANSAADAVKAAQLTADHALAQASAAPTTSGGGGADGGGGESGGDGGSPDDPEAGDGFNNRFADGHPPALPVPLTSYTVGQIVGGVANEFPALFANYPSDAETVAACQEYVLRTIWHLQQAGFTAGRQRNPSLLISNDKITVFVDGTYRAYDIASLGGAGSPNVPHIIRVSPADYVADAGTPD